MDENADLMMATKKFFTAFVGVFLVSFLFMRTFRRHHPPQKIVPLPPSIPSLPIVGSYLFMRCGGIFHRFFAKKAKILGPIFSCKLGSQQLVVLNDRESIQEALVRKSAHFSDRFQSYIGRHYFNPGAKGILYRPFTEDFHRYHQLILSVFQEFGLGQIRMEERILREVEELLQQIDALNGKAFDPEKMLSLCTLNIMAAILFARRLEQKDRRLIKLRDDIHAQIHSPKHFIVFCPVLRYVPYFRRAMFKGLETEKEMLEFVKAGIESSVELRNEVPSFAASFVDREGADYDKADLAKLCVDLLEAGSDTTATTIAWSLVLLANHPDIQERIREELDARIPRRRLPNSTDMSAVPFVEATIMEVLRISTVVPLALPHKVTADTTVGGFLFPKGTVVFPNLHAVHMDEAVWGDPEAFRPERFLDETGMKLIGKNRIIPFSVGRRSCLGERIARQELFLLFASLLQRYTILPPEGQTKVICRETPAIVVAPSEFQVRMVPRRDM